MKSSHPRKVLHALLIDDPVHIKVVEDKRFNVCCSQQNDNSKQDKQQDIFEDMKEVLRQKLLLDDAFAQDAPCRCSGDIAQCLKDHVGKHHDKDDAVIDVGAFSQ